MITRFLINLREAEKPTTASDLERFSRFSAPNFHIPTLPDLLGNMGQPLGHGSVGDRLGRRDGDCDEEAVEPESQCSSPCSSTEV